MKVIGIRIALSLWIFALSVPPSRVTRSGRTTGPDGSRDNRERGDVPGWVMITLVTST